MHGEHYAEDADEPQILLNQALNHRKVGIEIAEEEIGFLFFEGIEDFSLAVVIRGNRRLNGEVAADVLGVKRDLGASVEDVLGEFDALRFRLLAPVELLFILAEGVFANAGLAPSPLTSRQLKKIPIPMVPSRFWRTATSWTLKDRVQSVSCTGVEGSSLQGLKGILMTGGP